MKIVRPIQLGDKLQHGNRLTLATTLFLLGAALFSVTPSRASEPGTEIQDFSKLRLTAFDPSPRVSDFTLKDIHGKEVRLNRFRGKPLMLYFWATW